MFFCVKVRNIRPKVVSYFKDFTGLYTNLDGEQTLKTYSLYVKNIQNNILTHVNPAGEFMWNEVLYSGFRPNTESGFRVVSANKMFEFVSNIIDSGNALNVLYIIEGE